MTALSRDEQLALAAEASRAPSVHNIQPARWRFVDQGVVLLRANDRALPVADPSGHDVAVSLGAAFEGMAIALSRRGLSLGAPTVSSAIAEGCTAVVEASVDAGGSLDPLAKHVFARRAYRGKFEAATSEDIARLRTLERSDARIIGQDRLATLAKRHDDATWRFESQNAYHRELWRWLRLSRSHPDYHRDGLTADCLALSAPERWLGNYFMAPARFSRLAKLGVARALVSEAGQVRSAAGAIVFCPQRTATPFDVGRRFYRLWLEVTAAGLHMVPMSASADDEATRAVIANELALPADRRIANVMRVGRVRADTVAESPRLPAHELLV